MICRKFDDCFWTVTPFLRTSSGSRGSARRTRLLTLVAAWSTSVPVSKVTLMLTEPFDDEVDER